MSRHADIRGHAAPYPGMGLRAWIASLVVCLLAQSAATFFLAHALAGDGRDRWTIFITCQVAAVLMAAVVIVRRPPPRAALTDPKDA